MAKTTVMITGREYTIVSNEGGEYVNRVAYELNERIGEVSAQYVGLPTNTATVLAALNMLDELIKTRELLEKATDELKEQREKLRQVEIALSLAEEKAEAEEKAQLQKLTDRIDALEAENEKLRDQQGTRKRR